MQVSKDNHQQHSKRRQRKEGKRSRRYLQQGRGVGNIPREGARAVVAHTHNGACAHATQHLL